jgi:hypothetical protein
MKKKTAKTTWFKRNRDKDETSKASPAKRRRKDPNPSVKKPQETSFQETYPTGWG